MDPHERIVTSSAFDTRSSFVDQEFNGLDLADRAVVGKEFEGCSFVSCDLKGALVDRCRFVACEFRSSDLSMLVPRDSSFRDVSFLDSRLIGIDWTQAETTLGLDVTFERSILDGGSFMKLELHGLRMIESRAQGVNFVGGSLTDSDFTGTDLSDSQFSGSDLRTADLSGAENVMFDALECQLKDTKLSLEAALRVLGRLGIVVPHLE